MKESGSYAYENKTLQMLNVGSPGSTWEKRTADPRKEGAADSEALSTFCLQLAVISRFEGVRRRTGPLEAYALTGEGEKPRGENAGKSALTAKGASHVFIKMFSSERLNTTTYRFLSYAVSVPY